MKTKLKITTAVVLGAVAGALADPAWMIGSVGLGEASVLALVVAAQVLHTLEHLVRGPFRAEWRITVGAPIR